jgi:exodeoxyribonuclease VIII
MKRPYLSYSALKAFAKSPNHYLQYVQREFQETNAMKQGSALHCLVLEPEDFADRYIVAPEIDRRTKGGKAEYAAFLEAAGEKTVLTADQAEAVFKMTDAITSHRKATYLLKGKFAEAPVAGNIHGIDFRGIVDAWDEHDIVDVKTTTDASPEGFRKAASNFDYHLQAAIYKRITKRQNFYWIAVESAAPYNVAVYEPTQESLEAAEAYLHELVERFKAWDGEPVGYGENIYELDLPPWHPAMRAWNQPVKPELDTNDNNFNSFLNSL